MRDVEYFDFLASWRHGGSMVLLASLGGLGGSILFLKGVSHELDA
jgi:hypothetical protein